MFLDGELWWLDEKTEGIARIQQEDRVSQDAWEGEIAKWVEHMDEVSAMEIATALDCLNIEKGKVGRAETNRITSVLATLGFTPHGKFTSGQNKDRRKYVRKNGHE